ncbi:MAG TPA: hypothetical protein VMG58_02695 [Candidatus Sulfotelmatobacter sp.]|nr:hypothetical protein [Candidatus Sulfotelmatobacter sp.]
MRRHPIPRALRRKLRRLGKCWRPVVVTSGLKEWSDDEIARLRSGWMKGFLHRHICRSAFLVLLYLMAFGFLAASFERYWHWVTTVEAVAGEPVKMVDKWKAYCVVHASIRACKPAVAGTFTHAAASSDRNPAGESGDLLETRPNPEGTEDGDRDRLQVHTSLPLDHT